ncbi:TonB family protein [Thiohalophilus sp.]|uniref:TonB family protein n=1 Tax=Thiohalophilus sp. TaxID=3028392 RepID=UPI00397578BE
MGITGAGHWGARCRERLLCRPVKVLLLGASLVAHVGGLAWMLGTSEAEISPVSSSTRTMQVTLVERKSAPESRPEPEPEPEPQTEPESEPEPQTKPESEPQTEPESEPEPQAEPVESEAKEPLAESVQEADEPEPVTSEPVFEADYLNNRPPAYPRASLRQGEQGNVRLRVRVGPDGEPQEVKLARSSGSARLDRAALEAVKRWRFEPARRGGTAVAAWVVVPITFKLES